MTMLPCVFTYKRSSFWGSTNAASLFFSSSRPKSHAGCWPFGSDKVAIRNFDASSNWNEPEMLSRGSLLMSSIDEANPGILAPKLSNDIGALLRYGKLGTPEVHVGCKQYHNPARYSALR